MPFIFDTCAISELISRRPTAKAVEALTSLPRDEVYLSVITIGELQAGIEEAPPSERKVQLAEWFSNHILTLYRERTLLVDIPIAIRWGILKAHLRMRGFPMQTPDSLIAATALVHGLTVVTRNEADFAHAGVRVYNPWK